MRRQVFWSEISLDFNQTAGQPPATGLANQDLAEQVASNLERVALEEVEGKDLLDEGEG